MSVRAHRILKVEYAERPSFNLWHDEKLMKFLDDHMDGGFYAQLTDGGVGVVCIEPSVIQEAINSAKELELDDDTVAQLKADVEASEGSIDYDCF